MITISKILTFKNLQNLVLNSELLSMDNSNYFVHQRCCKKEIWYWKYKKNRKLVNGSTSEIFAEYGK